MCICPQALLSSTVFDAIILRNRARILMALRKLECGEMGEAKAILGEAQGVRSPDLWWEDHSDTELIVLGVLRTLLSGSDDLWQDLDHSITNCKFKMRQQLWHSVAYLSGAITEAEYLSQPCREDIGIRLSFVKAIAHDVAGRRRNALKEYRPFDEKIAPCSPSALIRQSFARWRIQELVP